MAWRNQTVAELSNNSSEDKHLSSSLIIGICGFMFFPVIPVILFLMLFVYKTYKTTFQRMIVYYIVLSLWLDVSAAVQIVEAFTEIDGRWACNIIRYLMISSQFAWYMYVTAIANFSLFLTIYLTRMKGRSLSKRSSRCMECTCVILAVTTGLTVASVIEIDNRAHDMKCVIVDANLKTFWMVSLSAFFGMDLEVISVSISLCVVFCFVRRRIRNRQTAALLQNSVIHVAVYASIMGLDFFRMGYHIYSWSKFETSSRGPDIIDNTTLYLLWNIVYTMAGGISVIIQAVLCIQTSTERNTCCKRYCSASRSRNSNYIAIDGNDTATNPASSHVSPPSYTVTLPVRYTGEFTQITASVNGDGESEQSQL